MTQVLTRAQVEQTAASIVAVQEPSGAIPWTPGEHTDVWNHLEAAMALVVGDQALQTVVLTGGERDRREVGERKAQS